MIALRFTLFRNVRMVTQLAYAILVSAVIAAVAYWRGSLAKSGAVGALVVGALTFGFGGWEWGVLLVIFFISSSLLSHYKEDEKQTAAEKFDKGHKRDIGQVMANGGLGALAAVLAVFSPPGMFIFFMGVMATVTADTWATELGTLSKRPPRLITNGRIVETGTSGGVSWLGTAVSLVGGLLIGLAAGLMEVINGRNILPGAPILGLVGAISGLVGSLFDSLLGATIQRIYYCHVCQKDTERKLHKCGHSARPLRGWAWLNNDMVNLLASLVGGSTAVILLALL